MKEAKKSLSEIGTRLTNLMMFKGAVGQGGSRTLRAGKQGQEHIGCEDQPRQFILNGVHHRLKGGHLGGEEVV